jgi:hypothetical protein
LPLAVKLPPTCSGLPAYSHPVLFSKLKLPSICDVPSAVAASGPA